MITRHLNAPLHESEERKIDRALMQELSEPRCMTWQELAEHRARECERLISKCRVLEAEIVTMCREYQDLKDRVARYYKELR